LVRDLSRNLAPLIASYRRDIHSYWG
jgi:hypothetical protein